MKIYIYSLLNLSNFICCLGLSIIAPFFPSLAQTKNVSEEMIGLIFSTNPIGSVIASLLIGKLLTKNNQYAIITSGLFIQAISLFFFTLLPHITSRELFITLSLGARLFDGFGSSMLLTPFYAMIPSLFQNDVERKMALAEFASAFGYLSGPIFGSILYSFGGFKTPFYVFGVLSLFICIPLLILTLKQKKRVYEREALRDIQVEVNSQQSTSDDEQVEIGYWKLCKQYSVLASLLCILVVSILFTFYSPIYATYVQETYGVNPERVGYYMAATSIAYSLTTFLVSFVKKHKIYYIFFGMLGTAMVQPLIGQYFMNTQSLWLTVVGQALYGCFSAFPYILALPYINEVLAEKYPQMEDECNRVSSALFNASVALGEFSGPLISAALDSKLGFGISALFMGGSLLFVSILFIPIMMKKTRSKQESSLLDCNSI